MLVAVRGRRTATISDGDEAFSEADVTIVATDVIVLTDTFHAATTTIVAVAPGKIVFPFLVDSITRGPV